MYGVPFRKYVCTGFVQMHWSLCSLYGLLAYILVYLYCFCFICIGHYALVLTETVSYAFHI